MINFIIIRHLTRARRKSFNRRMADEPMPSRRRILRERRLTARRVNAFQPQPI